MSTYPEHDKLAEVKEDSQTIGYFLDWLQSKATIAKYEDDIEIMTTDGEMVVNGDPMLMPHSRYSGGEVAINKLLADYYGIDYNKLMEEKDAMLAEIRQASADVGDPGGGS